MADIVERLRATLLDKDNFPRMKQEKWLPVGLAEEAAAEIERLRAALEFYRDPFAWKKQHDPDNDVSVPDFYGELCFGDTAEAALHIEQLTEDRT